MKCPTCQNEMTATQGRERVYNCAFCPEQWGLCNVCGEFHQTGVVRVWFNCLLTDKGLDELDSRYMLKSDGDSLIIGKLIEEIRRLRGLPLRYDEQPVGEDL